MRLDNLYELLTALDQHGKDSYFWAAEFGSIFCSICRAVTKVDVESLTRHAGHLAGIIPWRLQNSEIYKGHLLNGTEKPSLLEFCCTNCSARFTVVVTCKKVSDFVSPTLIILPRTRPTQIIAPPEVSYYFEQAQTVTAVGAYSAAFAMYRSALGFILADQGYKGDLDGKIALMTAEQSSPGSSKRWLYQVDPSVLITLKELGDISMHASEGIPSQPTLDDALEVQEAILFLIGLIYERPQKSQERLEHLKSILKSTK